MTEFERNSLKVAITLAIFKDFKDMALTKELAIEILDYAKENIGEANLKCGCDKQK